MNDFADIEVSEVECQSLAFIDLGAEIRKAEALAALRSPAEVQRDDEAWARLQLGAALFLSRSRYPADRASAARFLRRTRGSA